MIAAVQTFETGRIDTVSQIDPDRPHGRPIANTEADRVNRVVEVGQVSLVEAEGYIAQARVDIAEVVE